MADAKKCDRCGAFYEAYRPGKKGPPMNGIDMMDLGDPITDEKLIRRFELCPTCAAYLHAVLIIEPVPAGRTLDGKGVWT